MHNPLYFSDKFQPIAKKLKFVTVVGIRFLIIALKRKKSVELLHLRYSTKYLFDKSFLIISYKFRNALWYNFKNLKKTIEDKQVVFNPKNIPSNNITLEVYGFFQKTIYHINLKPENILEAKTFKVSTAGFQRETAFTPPINLERKNALLNLPKINIAKTQIVTNHSSYNQTDFI